MNNLFFLLAGLSSIFTALLYMINGIVTVGLLRQNNVDIEKAPKQISCTAKDDLNASFSADQRPEMNQQHVIDYIGEELDQNLDNETKSHDNNSTDYNINHCKNCSNNDANSVVTVGPKERYRYAPARNSNISKSSAPCNQKLHQRSAGIWSQVSRRKMTRIPLIVSAEAEDFNENHHIEHFNAHFLATQKHGPLLVHSKTAEECEIIIRSRYSKGKDDSSRHSVYERSLDDDSTSGSIVEPVYYYNNSVQMELENLDLAIQPELRLVQLQAQKIPDYSYSGSDDLSLEQMSVIPSHSCGQRGNGKESQRRCFLKHDYRRGSRDIQHLSYITHKESDDEDSSSHTNYRNAVRSRQKISQKRESVDPSCMPTIVTAIDSGRESDIIRKNPPRRTNSRDKKMRNRGFDVVIRAQNDGERFGSRRRTLSASNSSHNKLVEAYLVTEF
nr:Bm9908 [Brugia malayi]